MKFELFWLVMTAILTGLLWIPYILDRMAMRGIMGTLKNPGPRDRAHSGWATRLMFDHQNTVENLVVFAVLILVLGSAAILARRAYGRATLGERRTSGSPTQPWVTTPERLDG